MERRMLLAVLLSFLTVSLYGMATGQCTPPEKPEGDEAPVEGPDTPAKDGGGEQPVPAPAQPVPPPAPVEPGKDRYPAAEDRPAKRVSIETTELRVVLTERGGSVEGITLRNSYENDKKRELVVVAPFADDQLLGHVDDELLEPTGKDQPPGPMRTHLWTYEEATSEASPEVDAIFSLRRSDGATWRKQWVFHEDEGRFDVHLRLSLLPPEGTAVAPQAVKVLVTSGLLREPPNGAAFQYPNTGLVRLARMSEPDEFPDGVDKPDLSEVDADDLRLLGARTHYYIAGYYAEPEDPATADVRTWWGTRGDPARREAMRERVAAFMEQQGPLDPGLEERIRVGVHAQFANWLVLDVPTQPGAYADIPLYVGPISRHVLRQEVYANVQPVITYQMAPDILADALLAIYDLFRSLLGSAGLGVILMTLVVRGLMMPLSIRNQLSMRGYSRKIARVKPKLDELKKKYGSNIKKMREEQAKLYREHGIGFPTGCLMLLVQMPIFFSLFSSLRTEYTLRNEAFLWIQDLGGPDRLIEFGTTINLFLVQVSSLNILPLMMVALSIWQQRMMPKPADEQQAQQMRMMKWLPIVFAVILYNYTAALAIYMVLSSAVAIAESRIVRHKDAKNAPEGGAEGAWPGGAMGM